MSRVFISAVLGLFFIILSDPAVESQGSAKSQVETGLAVTDLGLWRDLQKGVASRTVTLERSQPNYTVELKLVRFNSELITARVLDSGEFQLRSASAKTFADPYLPEAADERRTASPGPAHRLRRARRRTASSGAGARSQGDRVQDFGDSRRYARIRGGGNGAPRQSRGATDRRDHP